MFPPSRPELQKLLCILYRDSTEMWAYLAVLLIIGSVMVKMLNNVEDQQIFYVNLLDCTSEWGKKHLEVHLFMFLQVFN